MEGLIDYAKAMSKLLTMQNPLCLRYDSICFALFHFFFNDLFILVVL